MFTQFKHTYCSIFKSNIVGRLGMENPDQLVEWIKLQNDKMAKRSNSVWLGSYRYVRSPLILPPFSLSLSERTEHLCKTSFDDSDGPPYSCAFSSAGVVMRT